MAQVKKRTASTVEQVRAWVETTAHHEGYTEYHKTERLEDGSPKPTHMVLRGHHAQLRIPTLIWSKCHIRAGQHFDTRLFRWDFDAEMQTTGFWYKKG